MSSYGLPLGRLYGPAWLNKELWFPGYKCLWTAEKDQSGHHCPDQECDAEIKTSCYGKLHVAFCLETITMSNGHKRFCGHRFQAESPKACALHGWGSNNENRVFQRAKNRLSFKLPDLIPHEQSDGQPDEVQEIACIKPKEMQLTEADLCVALEKTEATVQLSPEEKVVEALVKIEQNVEEFDNQFSYQKYNNYTAQIAAEEKLAAKKAARKAERAAAMTKGGKKCVPVDAAKHLRMTKAKKKN
ncbi:hypothetical protein E8E11_009476 [Didymella keratinophila]|nr:hypothetical protein E8E11_009476 [Didymella keratinophila]